MDINEDKSRLVSRGWDSFDRSFTVNNCCVNEDALRSLSYATCDDGYTLTSSIDDMSEQIDNLTKQVNGTIVSLDGLKEMIDKIPLEIYNEAGVSSVLFNNMVRKIYRRDFKTSFSNLSAATS